jgi:hypothetical protein
LSVRTLKLALGLVVSGFVLAAIYFTVVIAERQNAIRRITRYNPTWQANQVLNEFMTLDQSLRMFRDGESDVDKEEVQLRYDIFAGTINSLAEGGFREVLEQEPSFESTIHDLEGPTNDVAPLIKDLNSPEDA